MLTYPTWLQRLEISQGLHQKYFADKHVSGLSWFMGVVGNRFLCACVNILLVQNKQLQKPCCFQD